MLGPSDSRNQIRRILLLGATRGVRSRKTDQLELPLWGLPDYRPTETFLDARSDLAHAILLEMVLLIQMELTGLVASPLQAQGRRRLGLGSDPPLRFLVEWETIAPLEHDPWQLGSPSPGREQAYSEGLGRTRALAESAEMTSAQIREMARRVYTLAARCGPEEDLPGQILAHSARHRLRVTPAGRLSYQGDRSLGRGTGVVHTPPFLAGELVDILFAAGAKRENLTALDPACGSGLFLLSLAQRVAGRTAPGREGAQDCARRLSRMRSLHGVDLDPRACRVAAWNLSHWAAREAQSALMDETAAEGAPAAQDLGAFLDELFGRGFPYFLGTQIQAGNALHLEPSTFSPGFHWESRFPQVFQGSEPGFDLVLGNPPWISYGLRNRSAAPAEERLYYERLYPAATQYKLTMYPLFMELALRLCRAGGMHGFLVPDSLLTGHHFSRIRRHLLTEADLLELTLIESGLWAGVTAGQTVLYAARKRVPGGPAAGPVNVRNRFLRVGRSRAKQVWSSMADERRPYTESTQVWVPAAQYSAAGAAPLHVYRDEGQMDFLARMQNSPLRVRDVAWTYSGLIARYGQKSIQADGPKASFVLRNDRGQEVHADHNARERWHPALLSGGEIQPYVIRWGGGYLYMPEGKEEVGRVYKSGFDLGRYQNPKIFLRQTGDRLIAAFDRRGFYCLNNLHLVGVLEGSKIPPLLLAGILMSGPIQRAYRLVSQEGARPLAQVDLKTLEALPYPSDPAGVPVGSGQIPLRSHPQARKALRTLERSLAAGDPTPAIELAGESLRRGPDEVDGGPLKGRQILSLLLLRLMELREDEVLASLAPPQPTCLPADQPPPAEVSGDQRPAEEPQGAARRTGKQEKPSILQWVLDEICAILFQVPSA